HQLPRYGHNLYHRCVYHHVVGHPHLPDELAGNRSGRDHLVLWRTGHVSDDWIRRVYHDVVFCCRGSDSDGVCERVYDDDGGIYPVYDYGVQCGADDGDHD
ncbi:hypothetical protein FRC17_008550, partial [Serendipita sp. 399]